jgi:hypothetical protein
MKLEAAISVSDPGDLDKSMAEIIEIDQVKKVQEIA